LAANFFLDNWGIWGFLRAYTGAVVAMHRDASTGAGKIAWRGASSDIRALQEAANMAAKQAPKAFRELPQLFQLL